jgi:hypothetical protein
MQWTIYNAAKVFDTPEATLRRARRLRAAGYSPPKGKTFTTLEITSVLVGDENKMFSCKERIHALEDKIAAYSDMHVRTSVAIDTSEAEKIVRKAGFHE